MKTILAVDDEPKITEAIASYLEYSGYRVITAETGETALKLFEKEAIALVLLDLMLPDYSGEELCEIIRKRSNTPIIILTAKTAKTDTINGLKLGADDYITKPFSLPELVARIEALLRRSESGNERLKIGDIEVDTKLKIVRKNGETITLTQSETKLFFALINANGESLSRERLIDAALDIDFDGYDRVIDTHIKNLRQKIESDPKNPRLIITAHGLGYRFAI
ncbi:DNA-binding response regulator [Campylobacterota bacterium]|nr:DNA-binding response regulator [Campylobacterota bacterium]